MSSVKTKLKSPTGASAANSGKSSATKTSASSKSSANKSSSGANNTKPKTPSSSSAAVTKGMAKLKVSRKDDDESDDSAPNSTVTTPSNAANPMNGNSNGNGSSASISAAQAANARRRLSIAQAENTAAAVLDGVADPKSAAAASKVNQARRRLSIMGGGDGQATQLDGVEDTSKDMKISQAGPSASSSSSSSGIRRRPWAKYATLSKVGYVPFNPNKVNQDRFCDVTNFSGNEEKAIFGVFDGHGAVGHEVSSYVSSELPKHFLRQSSLESNPYEAITKAFIECNTKLASSNIDCTFSGTTAIAVYISGTKLYSCNAGDSRAVLGQLQIHTNGSQKLVAVALSNDHKPERADEKKRIIESRGRVEACKGVNGEDIGPARVWLLHQDVPGLAMTRSFGDLIAASVGVIARPDISERELTDQDKFMILASDGVWEFISSQEAVDIVAQGKSADEACRLLVDEAVKRWHAEEEVVDDITCVIVYFN